jgi:hypothetical protein
MFFQPRLLEEKKNEYNFLPLLVHLLPLLELRMLLADLSRAVAGAVGQTETEAQAALALFRQTRIWVVEAALYARMFLMAELRVWLTRVMVVVRSETLLNYLEVELILLLKSKGLR